MLRPYKFVVQAIAQQIDGEAIVGEVQSEPVVVFGCDSLAEWAADFPAKLAAAEVVTEAT